MPQASAVKLRRRGSDRRRTGPAGGCRRCSAWCACSAVHAGRSVRGHGSCRRSSCPMSSCLPEPAACPHGASPIRVRIACRCHAEAARGVLRDARAERGGLRRVRRRQHPGAGLPRADGDRARARPVDRRDQRASSPGCSERPAHPDRRQPRRPTSRSGSTSPSGPAGTRSSCASTRTPNCPPATPAGPSTTLLRDGRGQRRRDHGRRRPPGAAGRGGAGLQQPPRARRRCVPQRRRAGRARPNPPTSA